VIAKILIDESERLIELFAFALFRDPRLEDIVGMPVTSFSTAA